MATTQLQSTKKSESDHGSTKKNHQNTNSEKRQESPRLQARRGSESVDDQVGEGNFDLTSSTPLENLLPSSEPVVSNASNRTLQAVKAGSKASTRLRECPVCAETKGKWLFPNVGAPDCGHLMSACRACVARYITFEIEKRGQLQEISCLDCSEHLKVSYLESLVTKRDFKKIQTIVARKAIETHPRFRACLRPNCAAGQIHSGTSEVVVCTACGGKSCFKHGIPWHSGYTCSRYDTSHPDAAISRTSEELIHATTKKCPGPGCPFYIGKEKGCDWMYCRNCGAQWNWQQVEFGPGEVAPVIDGEQPSRMMGKLGIRL